MCGTPRQAAPDRILSYELEAFRRAFCRNQPRLCRICHYDFLTVISMDEWSRSPAADAGISYWLRYMEGTQGLQPSLGQPMSGGVFRLSERQSTELRALARAEGVGPGLIWEAAHHITLLQLTGMTDITTLSVDAGRWQPELVGMIGQFVNLLPTRSSDVGNATVRQLLVRLKEGRQHSLRRVLRTTSSQTAVGYSPPSWACSICSRCSFRFR